MLKKDLGPAACAVLLQALRGERGVLQFYRLNILDAPLAGILLIAADLDRVSSVVETDRLHPS